MSPADFDELVGGEPTGPERARLRRAHELLLAAGPPPELSPELESGPTLAMTLARPPRRLRRRGAVVVAVLVAVAAVFLAGYIVGDNSGSSTPAGTQTLLLTGTSLAPAALGSLRVEPAGIAGNRQLELSESGLPALPAGSLYTVYLVRNGAPWRPCGSFVVDSPNKSVTVSLTAPYRLERGDSWLVTRQPRDATHPGQAVLKPTGS